MGIPELVACLAFIVPLLALVMVLSARANNPPNIIYDRTGEADEKINKILLSQYMCSGKKP